MECNQQTLCDGQFGELYRLFWANLQTNNALDLHLALTRNGNKSFSPLGIPFNVVSKLEDKRAMLVAAINCAHLILNKLVFNYGRLDVCVKLLCVRLGNCDRSGFMRWRWGREALWGLWQCPATVHESLDWCIDLHSRANIREDNHIDSFHYSNDSLQSDCTGENTDKVGEVSLKPKNQTNQ